MQYFFFFNKLAIIEFLDNLTGKEMEGDSSTGTLSFFQLECTAHIDQNEDTSNVLFNQKCFADPPGEEGSVL